MFLELKNIKKTFASTEVLKNISLSIDKGQFLILVGGSGCGKSTLLNLIAGLDEMTSGEIHINGKNVNGLSPKERDIAMVFQSYALYPSMNVRDNIAFGLTLQKMPKAEIEANVKRVSDMLQISHLLDRKPAHLSGGQRQRVAMGRALARNPQLFLFDEPLSNLDAKLRVEMRAEIKRLHQRLKTTIVYVTHDQIEAMTLGDVIAVMKDGNIVQFGTPQEIYETPNSLYVASFIGSPSMNFIKGVVKNGVINCSELTLETKLAEGKAVIIGIRPENITPIIYNSAKNFKEIKAHIELIEPTGPDNLVTFSINNCAVVARTPPVANIKPYETIEMAFDISKVLVFDEKSGLRV